MVSADNAAGNIIVICKYHYQEVLKGELSKFEDNAYVLVDEREVPKIKDDMIKKMKSFKMNVSKIEKSFARMYWTAKMHKNPPGARFIAASARCISKPVSKILAKCFKVINWNMSSFVNGNKTKLDFDICGLSEIHIPCCGKWTN